MFVDVGDYSLSRLPVSIPIMVSETCFQIMGIDDNIVENNENFMLTVEAINPNDIADRNATVVISDNDGEKQREVHSNDTCLFDNRS